MFTSGLPRAISRDISLIGKSVGQAAGQLPGRLLGIIGVIAVGFTGGEHVQRMVDVVIPLCGIKPGNATLVALEVLSSVVLILQEQVNLAMGWKVVIDLFSQL